MSFATLFLIFMAPLPMSWYLPMAQSMQSLAAIVSEKLLMIAGVPVFREGYILQLPEFTMEVGAACSGLRSLMTVIALAAVISFFGTDRSRWYRWAIVIVSPLVAVAANCIRVVLTGFIAIAIDPKFAQGVYHEAGGMVMVGISALLIVGIASLLRRIDQPVHAICPAPRHSLGDERIITRFSHVFYIRCYNA